MANTSLQTIERDTKGNIPVKVLKAQFLERAIKLLVAGRPPGKVQRDLGLNDHEWKAIRKQLKTWSESRDFNTELVRNIEYEKLAAWEERIILSLDALAPKHTVIVEGVEKDIVDMPDDPKIHKTVADLFRILGLVYERRAKLMALDMTGSAPTPKNPFEDMFNDGPTKKVKNAEVAEATVLE